MRYISVHTCMFLLVNTMGSDDIISFYSGYTVVIIDCFDLSFQIQRCRRVKNDKTKAAWTKGRYS